MTSFGSIADSPTGANVPPLGEHGPGAIWTPPFPSTDDFVDFYDRSISTTNLLMVSFIPDDIGHVDFCNTMDRIQRHLQVQHINNYYMDEDFARKFGAHGPASWADDGFSYPEERHNTYLLRLGGPLPFSHSGRAGELNRPMVFSLPVSPVLENRPNRWLVIQAVPGEFPDTFLRPPMVVWRGIGLDASLGNAAAALLLITLYVARAVETWRTEDPTCHWDTWSFLSAHKVDIKAPPKPARGIPEPRHLGRGPEKPLRNLPQSIGGATAAAAPPEPGGPSHAQYGELFVITVCTAPIGMLARCFENLAPPNAAFGLPLYPIRICGWWFEMARGLDTVRTNDKKIGPGLELLTPCPTTRIKGLKPGATLGKIISALGTDGQSADGILGGFIHRSPGGDTQGPRILGTTALRPLASSLTPVEDSDIEDMKRLRERYGIFRRSLGLSTTVDARSPSAATPVPINTALAARPPRLGTPPHLH